MSGLDTGLETFKTAVFHASIHLYKLFTVKGSKFLDATALGRRVNDDIHTRSSLVAIKRKEKNKK